MKLYKLMKIRNRPRSKAENTEEMQNLLNLAIKVFLIIWDMESAGIDSSKY